MFFFFKQKTAYEMRISDWSSDVCSSDLERAKLEGWSSSLVRTLLDCYRPILEVKPAFGVRAPAMREDLTLGEMVHVGVEYPRPHEPLAIPDEHVSYGVS